MFLCLNKYLLSIEFHSKPFLVWSDRLRSFTGGATCQLAVKPGVFFSQETHSAKSPWFGKSKPLQSCLVRQYGRRTIAVGWCTHGKKQTVQKHLRQVYGSLLRRRSQCRILLYYIWPTEHSVAIATCTVCQSHDAKLAQCQLPAMSCVQWQSITKLWDVQMRDDVHGIHFQWRRDGVAFSNETRPAENLETHVKGGKIPCGMILFSDLCLCWQGKHGLPDAAFSSLDVLSFRIIIDCSISCSVFWSTWIPNDTV